MALLFPAHFGNRATFSSYEAENNLDALLGARREGSSDQVIHQVARQSLNRIEKLRPSSSDIVLNWGKSGAAYVLAGAATSCILGVVGYKLLYQGRSIPTLLSMCVLGGVFYKMGWNPLSTLSNLCAFIVRNSAKQAAQFIAKRDEQTFEANEKEARERRSEMLHQLSAIYDDCANHLDKLYNEVLIATNQVNESFELRQLRQMIHRLNEQLPVIKSLLRQADLKDYEIESLLQTLEAKVRFLLSRELCSLRPKQPSKNMQLMIDWPQESIRQIAIPHWIQNAVTLARQSHWSLRQQLAGYFGAIFAGIGTFSVLALAASLITASYADLQSNVKIIGALAMLLSSGVAIKKGLTHHHKIGLNAKYVQNKLNVCRDDLKKIYNEMQQQLNKLPPDVRWRGAHAIQERLPLIKKKIEELKITNNPSEILSQLERTVKICCSSKAEVTRPFSS